MLDSCTEQDQGGNHQLVDAIQGLLKRYKVHVPANLQVLVSRGIPCTCTGGHVTPPKSPVFARRKVGVFIQLFSSTCPFFGNRETRVCGWGVGGVRVCVCVCVRAGARRTCSCVGRFGVRDRRDINVGVVATVFVGVWALFWL